MQAKSTPGPLVSLEASQILLSWHCADWDGHCQHLPLSSKMNFAFPEHISTSYSLAYEVPGYCDEEDGKIATRFQRYNKGSVQVLTG